MCRTRRSRSRLGRQELAGRSGLGLALGGEVDVLPAGKEVEVVPLGASVAQKDEIGHVAERSPERKNARGQPSEALSGLIKFLLVTYDVIFLDKKGLNSVDLV